MIANPNSQTWQEVMDFIGERRESALLELESVTTGHDRTMHLRGYLEALRDIAKLGDVADAPEQQQQDVFV